MDIQLLQGPRIAPHIDDLARLRIEVFREFPYLYDGTFDYEAEYLGTYVRSEDSLCVLVRDQGRVVGASTALPLSGETGEFQQPFVEGGRDPARICYLAESVVLPASPSARLMRGAWSASTGAPSAPCSARPITPGGPPITSRWMPSGRAAAIAITPSCTPNTTGAIWTSARNRPNPCRSGSRSSLDDQDRRLPVPYRPA